MPSPLAITSITSREILDSRGNPTVESDVRLHSGALGRAAAPSGASTGAFEAAELRDGDSRFGGKGVATAVENVRARLAPELIGMNAANQRQIDRTIRTVDGTPNLASVGANAALSVSLAAAWAAAAESGLPLYRFLGGPSAADLPIPFMNVLNGGAHADNGVDVQEFMIAPVGVGSFSEAVRAGAEVYAALKGIAKQKGLNTNVGDEGGIAPELASTSDALELIAEAIEKAGYRLGTDIALALDVAATELYSDGAYAIEGQKLSSPQMADYLEKLAADWPIISIEDGCSEEDWDGWKTLCGRIGGRVQLVGDDLLVTNIERVNRAVSESACNAVLVKPNQIGTLTDTLDAIGAARKAGWGVMLSHRSGETEDTTIAHIAVATAAGQIKTGAPARSERTAKYNELLRIEEDLGAGARYPGWDALPLGVEPNRG